MSLPKSVSLCEVSLRDGLQSQPKTLSVENKLEMLALIAKAGFPAAEIGSLVSKRAVPQMANTPEVWAALESDRLQNTELRVLVVNPKGLLRARDMGIRHVQISVSASETHQLKNAGTPLSVMIPQFKEYASPQLNLSATISTAFGCPFEGKVPSDSIMRAAEGLMSFGVSEISLADTTGMAAPEDIYMLCEKMRAQYPFVLWGLHLHVRPENLASIARAGLEAGIERFDSSLLGLGGCPFDDGSAGNADSASLLRLFANLGIECRASLGGTEAAAKQLSALIG